MTGAPRSAGRQARGKAPGATVRRTPAAGRGAAAAPAPAMSEAAIAARIRQTRLAAAVLGGAMVLWMAGQWAGGRFGWQERYAFLFDMLAMAAFVWTMAVTWRLWRARQR